MEFPSEEGIQELWDTTVPIISETCTDAVCSSLPRHGPGKTVPVPGCCTSTNYFADGPHGQRHGSRSRTGLRGWDLMDPRACLRHHTSDRALQTNQLFRVLFYSFAYGQEYASHSFVATSCVKDLGLKVKTLEDPLHVSSPLGTSVRIDQIC